MKKIKNFFLKINLKNFLIFTCTLIVIISILFILSKSNQGLLIRTFIVNNLLGILTLTLVVISVLVLFANWRFTGSKVWFWRKITFVLIIFAYSVDKIFLERIYLTEVEKVKIVESYKLSLDSAKTYLASEYKTKEAKINFNLSESKKEISRLKDSVAVISAISQTRKEKIDFLNKDFLDKKVINDSLLNLIESLKKENAVLSEGKASVEKNDPPKEETKKLSSGGTKSTKKKKAKLVTPKSTTGKRVWH